MMKRLGVEDSTERLIDDARSLGRNELDALEADGWLLVDISERRARNGSLYYRHRFRHVSAPPRGVI
jgi:hypothetical protein